ncbi:hypothetical protein M422DRAFT_274098 [Sphaerobolus stellatus SS14]|uniref:Fungal-type protein kinase domain-containing protein n=1 Tax=Sphaerobolus stellatus (strain SS14) TaxID=990650 RepID=A0A0C9T7M9_SPHS4|nr:hypothetical protein M422DRAFT_274098 [Sphaerobolus stellatus SS14]
MPASPDVQAPAVRPDGAFISSEVDPEKVARNNVRLEELEKEPGGQRRTHNADKLVEVQKLQMANVVEFKAKGGPDDARNALIQLSRYARQILREQLDRRFIIGLTICFDKLNIYLFDRSSVVATNQ